MCAELKRGALAAVSCCSTPATAELRRQNTGDDVPAPGMVYGTLILALKKQGNVGEGRNGGKKWEREPCRVGRSARLGKGRRKSERAGLLGFAGREGKGAGLGCFWGLGWLGLGFISFYFFFLSYFKLTQTTLKSN